jgi:hypothetical protein
MIYWYLEGISDLRLQMHQVAQQAAALQATAAAAARKTDKAITNKKKKGGDKEKPKSVVAGSAATRLEVRCGGLSAPCPRLPSQHVAYSSNYRVQGGQPRPLTPHPHSHPRRAVVGIGSKCGIRRLVPYPTLAPAPTPTPTPFRKSPPLHV